MEEHAHQVTARIAFDCFLLNMDHVHDSSCDVDLDLGTGYHDSLPITLAIGDLPQTISSCKASPLNEGSTVNLSTKNAKSNNRTVILSYHPWRILFRCCYIWCSMDPITGTMDSIHQIPAHAVSPQPRGCHEGWQASLQLLRPGYWGYPLVMTNIAIENGHL